MPEYTGVLGAVLLAACLYALPAQAQVSLQVDSYGVTVEREGFGVQRLTRSSEKNGSTWVTYDNVGNSYPLGGYQAVPAAGGRDEEDEPEVIILGGYQAVPTPGGGGEEDEPEVVLVGGYQSVLDSLRLNHGATIEHDTVLGVDILTFPNEADPVGAFIEIITTKTLNGHPYYYYFRLLEFASKGVFGPGHSEPAEPQGEPGTFPNDRYLPNQWNLGWTRLTRAHWHTAQPRKAVRISIIDSGVGAGQQAHEGLDGTYVHHGSIAPTTGFPVPHGLSLITLLGDRSHDGDGIVGALGDAWGEEHCLDSESLLGKEPPQIFSYNVGDFGPGNVYVARAIRESIEERVDVINLSLALAYSPIVEQAIRDALAQNIIVIAAAGNYAPEDVQKPAKWPANMDGVISVGAADKNLGFSGFSARDGVDLLAPGEEIVVGGPDDLWYDAWGTSFAAPHVTAAVAMMRAVNPDLTPAEVLEALQARAWAKGHSDGIGFLNALSSLNHVLLPTERNRWVRFPSSCLAGAADSTSEAGGDETSAQLLDTLDHPAYDDAIDDDLFALEQVGAVQQVEEEVAALELPDRTTLMGNYPNPFNPKTSLRFYLPDAQHVRLAVYNMLGQEVRVLADGPFEPGTHELSFDARDLPSGVYLVRLEAGSETQVRTMTLMK